MSKPYPPQRRPNRLQALNVPTPPTTSMSGASPAEGDNKAAPEVGVIGSVYSRPSPGAANEIGFAERADAERREEIRNAWKKWLESFVWTHWCHFTFEHAVSVPRAMHEFQRWVRRVNMRARAPGGIQFFMVVESGPAGGRNHIHALLNLSGHVPSDFMEFVWFNGRREVHEYVDGGGAEGYVTKSLAGPNPEYHFTTRLQRKWTKDAARSFAEFDTTAAPVSADVRAPFQTGRSTRKIR